jgi:hypothetical protein
MAVAVAAGRAVAGVGDPQTKTDHPWYPGELSCSTFPRLFATQAALYERVTGRKADNDEDKALAAWYWRNINYHHCEMLGEDLSDSGWEGKSDRLVRDYWSGLFGYGFGICFDTHHQFGGEIWNLLGPNRCRTMGVDGHTTFEVFLKGGAYGDGKWALLDHDISTVVFTPQGDRLMGLMEVNKGPASVKNSSRKRGWMPGGLHPSDPDVYRQVKWAGYQTGYAGVPPIVNLRAGETLRRYAAPGLDDDKTFAYWGLNFNTKGIPGPERSRTWVNQPEKMCGSSKGSGFIPGQARYGNAVYTYKPDFAGEGYKEGVVAESDSQVTLEWYSPYVIAATPPTALTADKRGVLTNGCTGGLVVKGKLDFPVEVSTDQGTTWQKAASSAGDTVDLTDMAKGHHQYLLRLGAGAKALAAKELTIMTVCQCAQTVVPHVKAGTNQVAYAAGNQGFISAGPNKDQAAAHLAAGAVGSPAVALRLEAPRGAKATAVYAAAHVGCSAPPKPANYNIECSTDNGSTWKPLLKDYQVKQIPPEPNDWWSQAFIMGDTRLDSVTGPVQVRFSNTGNRQFIRVEAHLVYEVPNTSPVEVTYAWKEAGTVKTATHTYPAKTDRDAKWSFEAGAAPETLYVEYAVR